MAGRRGSYTQAWRIELGMKMFPGQVNFPPLGARTRITSGTYDFGASASADGVGSCRAAVRSALLDVAAPNVFLVLSLLCEPFTGSNANNNGIPVAARENAWLAATVLCRFAVDDAHEEALVGGIIENHPDFIDEAPFNPWALVRDTLLSMRMRILCIKYLDMQATGSPSERERAIVCFWRAAPGEAGDVRYVERGEL